MLNGKILVVKLPPPEKNKDGIVYTEAQTIKVSEGLVVNPGDSDLKKEDRIFFSEFSGAPITIEEQQFLILDYKEIWGVL